MNDTDKKEYNIPAHHIQQELCSTRPLYRRGKKCTAVKIYTINNESQHLVFYGVPKLNFDCELKTLCMKYGELRNFCIVENYKVETFTACYHVHFHRIQSARIAKRFLDNKSFYGGILHVCYAPEYETVLETAQKLKQRQIDVFLRLLPGPTQLEYANAHSQFISHQDRKRKHPALPITEKRLNRENSDQIWNGIPADLDPRIFTFGNDRMKIHKHFQMANPVQIGPVYGPIIGQNELNSQSSVICNDYPVSILSSTFSNTFKKECIKRIVFKNKI